MNISDSNRPGVSAPVSQPPNEQIADRQDAPTSACCGAKPYQNRCSECREACDWWIYGEFDVKPGPISGVMRDLKIAGAINFILFFALGLFFAALFIFGDDILAAPLGLLR